MAWKPNAKPDRHSSDPQRQESHSVEYPNLELDIGFTDQQRWLPRGHGGEMSDGFSIFMP
jgi:hypothetical protein